LWPLCADPGVTKHGAAVAKHGKVAFIFPPTPGLTFQKKKKLVVSLGADGEQELGKTSVMSFLKSHTGLFVGWSRGTRIAPFFLIQKVSCR